MDICMKKGCAAPKGWCAAPAARLGEGGEFRGRSAGDADAAVHRGGAGHAGEDAFVRQRNSRRRAKAPSRPLSMATKFVAEGSGVQAVILRDLADADAGGGDLGQDAVEAVPIVQRAASAPA